MKIIYRLTIPEANAVDNIASAYRLNAYAYKTASHLESDSIVIENEQCSIIDGVDYVLEAINSDDRELFKQKVSWNDQITFLNLARQLYRTLEEKWAGAQLVEPLPEFKGHIYDK